MKAFLINNRLILGVYLLTLLTAFVFIMLYEKNAIHLYVNQYVGNRYINAFFYNADHLGDGWMAPILVLLVTVVNVRAGIYTAAALLLASGLSTLLKYFVFADEHRPYYIFQYFDRHQLNLVDGVHVNIHNSFPSGHATQSFAILMSMGFFARRHSYKLLAVLIATLAAFSRVYLSQHWLVDIMAGSLIGTLSSMLFYFVFISRDKLPALNKPLVALFRRQQA